MTQKKYRLFWLKSFLLLVPFIYFIIINIFQPTGEIKWSWHYGIWFPITSYIVFWEGRKYFRIYPDMFKGRLSTNTLIGLSSHILFVYSIVSVATHINGDMYSYSVMWEAPAVLIVVTNIGHKLESNIKSSTLETYQKLESMRNSIVTVIRDNKTIEVKANQVNIGEIILVKNGGYVPLDGELMAEGMFNLSNITGESKDVKIKQTGFVLSGSYNIGQNIKIMVTKKSNDSTISHIVDRIEEVSSVRPRMQQVADKILKAFVPSILCLSIMTFILWMLVSYLTNIKLPWINHNEEKWSNALEASITVIAIACPCALGVATPLVYTVSSMLSVQHGIVINEPKALEEMNNIDFLALDKTGTITSSIMKVSKIHGDQNMVDLASSLEKDVNHPIAKSIFNIGRKKLTLTNVKHTRTIVSAVWNKKKVSISRYESNDFVVNSHTTNIALYLDGKVVTVFELENQIKPNVKKTISKLMKKGMKIVMITGDSQDVANHVASKVGITKVYANVSPDDKSKVITELQLKGKVAFVGDGFNDSIAIKQSNVSLAFASGSGSDITNSLADISIINNDFSTIEKSFKLSKMNKHSVIIALTYAFMFNIITIPVAMLLLVKPWVAALIMASSDILVAAHAFIYKFRGKKKLNKK